MEDVLSSNFKEFMTVLDQVKKYRAFLTTLPDFAIIIALSLIVGISAIILGRFDSVFVSRISSSFLDISFLFVVSLLTGLIAGVYWVNRKVKSVKVGQWKEVLAE